MVVTVHGRPRHVPSSSLKEFATEKVMRLPHYLPTITAIDVELYGEGHHTADNGQVVEVTVLAGGRTFRAKGTGGDPGSCIDIAFHHLCRQLTEFNHKRSGRPARLLKARRPTRHDVAGIADTPAPQGAAIEEDLVRGGPRATGPRQPMIARRAP
jgi:ribosomal subunit interface protein